MLYTIQANASILGMVAAAILCCGFFVSISILIQRLSGLQRQQQSNFKNMMNACRYLIELNRKIDKIDTKSGPTLEPNRLFRTDSAYQYAVQLFQTGRSIDEVVESCQLSWGEAELIQALHCK